MSLLNDMKSFKTSLLDIDKVVNDDQSLFNSAIIQLIKSKKTDMVCWLDWKVNDGFYKYNVFSEKLESTLYNFDPKQWYVYHLWNTQTLFICKCLGRFEMQNLRVSPVRLYGTYNAISLEKVMELMSE